MSDAAVDLADGSTSTLEVLRRFQEDHTEHNGPRLHLYDEDYLPAYQPWLEIVPLEASRAPTKPIDPELLSTLTGRCERITCR